MMESYIVTIKLINGMDLKSQFDVKNQNELANIMYSITRYGYHDKSKNDKMISVPLSSIIYMEAEKGTLPKEAAE